MRACTELYGGPETAHVTGTLGGEAVDVTITRNDGCGVADYEALFEALGVSRRSRVAPPFSDGKGFPVIRRPDRQAAAFAISAALAAVVGAAPPAGAAEQHGAGTDWAGCNALLPEDVRPASAASTASRPRCAAPPRPHREGDGRERHRRPGGRGAERARGLLRGRPDALPRHQHGLAGRRRQRLDARIEAQMRVLNQTFAGTGFSFSLASVEPELRTRSGTS